MPDDSLARLLTICPFIRFWLARLGGIAVPVAIVVWQICSCQNAHFSCSSNNCCVCVRNVVFLADILLESETPREIPVVAA